jgi:hypothetical protein
MAFHDGDVIGTLQWYERGASLGDSSSLYNLGTPPPTRPQADHGILKQACLSNAWLAVDDQR